MLRREDSDIVFRVRVVIMSVEFLMEDGWSCRVAGSSNVSTLIHDKIETRMRRLLLVY